MKLTENTKVRIKVPKHLYESIQAELAKKHDMEEMKTPHDGHEKVEETEVNEYYGVDPKLDLLTLALGVGLPIATAAAALVQQIGFKGAMELVKKSKAPKDKKAEIEKAIVNAAEGGEISEVTVGGKTPGLNLSKNDIPNRQYSKQDLKKKLIDLSRQLDMMKGLGSAEVGAFAKLLDDLMSKLNDPANLANQVKVTDKNFSNLTKNIGKVSEVTIGGKTPGLNLSKNDTPNIQYSKQDLKKKLISLSRQLDMMKGLGNAEIGALAGFLDNIMDKLKDPANLANQVKVAGKTFANLTKNIKAEGIEELEEVLDFETLMEAVKDAAKKKAEEKKKKEAEAKKKAEADKKK